jgi:hypothetical protein
VIEERCMGLAGHLACVGEEETRTVLGGKHNEKRPLGRPRCGWEGNFKTRIEGCKYV